MATRSGRHDRNRIGSRDLDLTKSDCQIRGAIKVAPVVAGKFVKPFTKGFEKQAAPPAEVNR